MATQPKLLVRLPTAELARSLSAQLWDYPGEMGLGVSPPDVFEVHLDEFPTTPEEVEEVLHHVQEWLDGSGLDSLTVCTAFGVHELRARKGSS
jgi:hypothetical protein